MIFILDNQQNTIGVASNSNPLALPYLNDWHTENLEGVNTYEFSVPADHESSGLLEAEGHVIIQNLDGENLLFTIKEVSDGNDAGKKLKNIFCEETAVTELLGDVQRPATFISTTLEAVATSVLTNSYNWKLGQVPFTPSYDVEFTDYTTVLEALRSLMTQYSMEMYFTVKLSGTKIIEKQVNIVEERGTKTNVRFDYSYDLRGVGRTENSSNVVTALIGVGKGDSNAERVNLSTLSAFVEGDFYKENGADWIGSYSALQQFGKNGRHRFGVFIDDKSDTKEDLKRRTLAELEKRIVPDVHYSASISTLERLTGYDAKKLRLGDTIVINDKSFEPAIVINGRVMELRRSYTRNDVDEVDLGKYKPITLSPNKMLLDLQNIITKSEEKWNVASQPLYTWVKYADSPTTGMSDNPTGKAYIGFAYNKTTQTESTTYSDYNWSLIKGTDGVAGQKGADGQTTYTWVKYADTNTGSGMSDSPTGKRFLGIAINKTTATESTVASDYSWSPLYDNVIVGGRNWLKNTANFTNLTNWSLSKGTGTVGDYVVEDDATYGQVIKATKTADTGSWWVLMNSGIALPQGKFTVGKTYTLSFLIKNEFTVYVNFMDNNGTNAVTTSKSVGINPNWTKFTYTFTATATGNIPTFYLAKSDSLLGNLWITRIQLEEGNIATDWTPAIEDVQDRVDGIGDIVSGIDERTTDIVGTVVYSEAFDSILSDKANVEDISDMATGEMLTASKNETVNYVDGRLDGKGGINESINAVSSALTKTANEINAKFSSSGGINLIKNSLGYAGQDFWTVSGTVNILQNAELETLGFGSGWTSPAGVTGYIEQKIPITPKNPDGTPKKHSVSFWVKKTVDNATNSWVGMDIYAGGVKLAFIGKGAGQLTNGWELGVYTFDTTFTEVTVRVTFGANAVGTVSGVMLNVGADPLQWQHANGEVYNTNVQMNLNGIKVINEQTKGYTIMSPQEFSGYAMVEGSMQRVFTLNEDTTEVTKLDVDAGVTMGTVKMIQINTTASKGWAFVSNE